MPVVTRDIFGLRTSDPASQALHETLVRGQSRQARLHIASFNGTLAGGLWSSRKTVIPELVNLIDQDENIYETPLNGVGADGSWEDFIRGGIGGWGTLRNVCHALSAWAARYLALIIFVIGLPKNGDEKLFHRIYKACSNKTIFNHGVVDKLLEGYECWDNVRINALCCFDTVGSLGLPLTGLARPLTIFRGKKRYDIVSDVAPNVDFAFHALSLHELREPYYPTLMRGRNIFQVSFPGSHGNLGWMSDKEGLFHAPLAWMIQQLSTHVHIRFDEDKLACRFPSYYAEGEPATGPEWFNGDIKKTNSVVLAVIGRKVRQPGRTNSANGSTDLKVHIGARLRNDIDNNNAVPGYILMAPTVGPPYWARRLQRSRWTWRTNSKDSNASSSTGSSASRRAARSGSPGVLLHAADRIEEAPIGLLEARLLGLPQSIATIV
ncbi:hypothetical protein BP5796_12553 [Coleophoma crateriformis]|uniref:T6SS Phospholipase effector Tle1-like catalytic domain-containing protein n=1 Tax=Coleophoma crateriformis TaxID=565419 RepID=A0A3D8Q7F0_9HELO|nr:hypothetical protein BP5796_12553 [Coleophoma crateriformis]